MGYQTTYSITKFDGDMQEFARAFSAHKEAKENGYGWFGFMSDSEPWKWYEHEEHIKSAMLASASNRLTLHGEGEEQGDVWDKEFTRLGTSPPSIQVKKFKYRLVREETPE